MANTKRPILPTIHGVVFFKPLQHDGSSAPDCLAASQLAHARPTIMHRSNTCKHLCIIAQEWGTCSPSIIAPSSFFYDLLTTLPLFFFCLFLYPPILLLLTSYFVIHSAPLPNCWRPVVYLSVWPRLLLLLPTSPLYVYRFVVIFWLILYKWYIFWYFSQVNRYGGDSQPWQ